jgi:hypothetical protein
VRLYSDVRKQTIIRQQPDDFFLVLGVHPEIKYTLQYRNKIAMHIATMHFVAIN